MKKNYLIIVSGDWNDADIVTSVINTADEDDVWRIVETYRIIKKMLPFCDNRWDELIEALFDSVDIEDDYDEDVDIPWNLEVNPRNGWIKEHFTLQEVNLVLRFEEWEMPSGYDVPCHTLEDVCIYEIANQIL